MEKSNSGWLIGGLGLAAGVILTVIFNMIGAKPKTVNLGPVEFEMPTPTPSVVSESFTEEQQRDMLLYSEDFDDASRWVLEGNRIEDGCLIVRPNNDAVPQDATAYTDFVLESRFYIPASGSMAFYVRHQRPPCEGWNCSIQIGLYYGSENTLAARRLLGDALEQQIDIKKVNIVREIHPGNWNTISIQAKGPHYTVTLNGTRVIEFVDDTYSAGSFLIDNAGPGEIKVDYIHIYAVQQ